VVPSEVAPGPEVLDKNFGLLTSLTLQLGGETQKLGLAPDLLLKDRPVKTTRVTLEKEKGGSLKGFQCQVPVDSETGAGAPGAAHFVTGD